ncbi:hypothetical protein FACS1894166_09920 [Bacilli bacterium]|nr:hypothetical protein FACS1894166_09920 [Bacilli bacterium]
MTKKSLIKSLIPIAMCVAGTIIGVSISSCTPNTEKITIQLADGVEQASINLEKSNPTSVIQLETVNYNRTELGCVLKIPKGYSEITQFIEINNNSILQITD